SLGVKLDFPVEGKLSFQVHASIPVNKAGDVKAYKLQGTAQTTDLVLAGIKIYSIDAELLYAGGVLELKSLRGRFDAAAGTADTGPGTFRGSGRLQVVPLGDLTADLSFDRISLSQHGQKERIPLGGTVSGQFSVRAP